MGDAKVTSHDSEPLPSRWPWLAAVLALFSLEVFAPMFAGLSTAAPSVDANNFHLPQISFFIQHPLSFFDYPATSATTPGHHLLMAWCAKLLGYESVSATSWGIRVLSALFGHGLIAVIFECGYRLSRRPRWAAIAVLPLACSSYVVSASIWVVTDNGALFFFSSCVFVLLFERNRLWLVGLVSALMVLWRQIYLPVVGAFGIPFLLPGRQRRDLVRGLVATLAGIAIVGAFAWSWGALTPGTTQVYNEARFQAAVPLQALALFGLFLFPFGLFFEGVTKELTQAQRLRTIGIVSVLVLALWLAGPSNYDSEAGRWGSIVWLFAKKTPLIADRSVAVLLLAIIGATGIALMGWRAYFAKDRYAAELQLLMMYLVGYSVQVLAWQRYVEPIMFVTLAVFACREGHRVRRIGWLGPVLLALVFGTLTQARIWGALGRVLG